MSWCQGVAIIFLSIVAIWLATECWNRLMNRFFGDDE